MLKDNTPLAPDIQTLVADHPKYVEALVEHWRWNFLNDMIDMGAYSVTRAALSETTVVPYFISQMTSSAFIIGILPAIGWVGLYLPQIFGAYLVHSNPRRKPYIVRLVWLERVMILLMFLISLSIGHFNIGLALALFLLAYFAFWITTGFLIPSYSDFYAKHIPFKRGMFIGLRTLAAGGMGLLGATLIRWRLAEAIFPYDFQSVLVIALLASIPAVIAVHNRREVPFPKTPVHQSLRRYLGRIPQLLREHPDFVRFIAALSIIALGKMTMPFIAVYAIERFKLDGGVVAIYSGILLVAQSLSALLWGYLGDRIGYRWVWLSYALLIFAQAALTWWAPGPAWFYIIFVLAGAALGVEYTAKPDTVYSLSPAAETSRFVGLMNTGIAPWLAIGPLFCGALINRFSYPVALGVGALIAALGVPAAIAWIVSHRD